MFKRLFSQEGVSTYLWLLRSLRPYRTIFALGLLATVFASLTDAGIAWAVKPLVDKGLVARDQLFLTWLPLFAVVIFLARAGFNFASTYYVSRVGRSVVMDFRQKIFRHLLQLPASYYDRESAGKLLALLVYNVEQLASATTDSLVTIVKQLILALGLIIVMFIISWRLSLIFMIMAPIVMIVMRIMTGRLRHLSGNVQETVGDVTHIAREAVEGFRVIRTFGGEEYEQQKFNRATRHNRHQELKVVVTNGLGTGLVQILIAFPIAILAYLLHFSIFHISVGSFGALLLAMLRLQTPLRRLTKISTPIQKGIAGAQSIFDLLEIPPERDAGKLSLARAKGAIAYDKVTFAYAGATEHAVTNVSFTIEPGQMLALVGHSGSGKSTLVNLLPRFYDLTSGSILLDGVNIDDYRLVDLRKQISFVSQNITLFNDTVANNIAYGRLADTSRSDIIKAAQAAHFMSVVEQLPQGLDTVIGEDGVMLSGGQRQRLAIARAVLKNAPILILDEATSALDTQVERQLQTALEELMSTRTTLVIAHRLSTVENADRIIVLENGSIVEEGNHHELLDLGGYYAKLYRMQFSE